MIKNNGTMTLEEIEAIEKAALLSAKNFGQPEKMWLQDPSTEEYVYIDFKDPSPEAIELLEKIVNISTNRSGAV